jgi:nitrogen-specific signal transduction histidine kinase
VAFRSEIVQVITNLLLNALDATPAGGQVVAHLYPAPSWLREIHARYGYCLSIADTGTGVAPQDRARIFQPFFTTKGERGTGLGLWVSAGIIDRIGGSIRVWSTCRPGRSGTCFSIFLSVEQAIFTPLRRRRKELSHSAATTCAFSSFPCGEEKWQTQKQTHIPVVQAPSTLAHDAPTDNL